MFFSGAIDYPCLRPSNDSGSPTPPTGANERGRSAETVPPEIKPMHEMEARARSRAAIRSLAASLAALSLIACAPRAEDTRPSASASPSAATPPAAELLRRADEAYAARGDLARVREGLQALRRIRAVNRDDYEAAWRAARLDYTLADGLGDSPADSKEKEEALTDGIEAGQTATRVDPDKPEGHFWLGANYGAYAEFKGVLTGTGWAEKMRKEMEAVLKIDDTYEGGSAYVALGQLDLEMPGMLGGDANRAVTTLEKGLRVDPTNPLIHLRLAEAYLATRRKEDARRELNWIVNAKPDPDFVPEHDEAVKRARDLLGRNF
jgi:tetratricopeptide (TPR) repeat protein